MAQSQCALRQEESIPSDNRHGRHKLDELDADRVARHLLIFDPDKA